MCIYGGQDIETKPSQWQVKYYDKIMKRFSVKNNWDKLRDTRSFSLWENMRVEIKMISSN